MIQRSCGIISVNQPLPFLNNILEATAKKLDCVQTYGGLGVDTMGFGKTLIGLFFLLLFTLYTKEELILCF